MTGKLELKDLALSSYTKIFTAEPTYVVGTFIRGRFPTLGEEQRLELEKEYSLEETWKALKEMGPLKALGPDWFQVLFFQKTWNVASPTLFNFVKRALEKV